MGARFFRLSSGTRQYPLLTGDWLLGRAGNAGIAVADPLASREHAVLRVSREGVEVEDLGSRNGTFLNERPLKAHEREALQAGDVLRIGDTLFALEEDARAGAVSDEPIDPVPVRFGAGDDFGEATHVPEPPSLAGRARSRTTPPSEISTIIEPRTAVLALGDREWADTIRRSGAIHPNLTVRIADPAGGTAVAAGVRKGILLLDVDAAPASDEILRCWNEAACGPVLIASARPEDEGVRLARQLGAAGYVRHGKSAILVVAQLRYHLQRSGGF